VLSMCVSLFISSPLHTGWAKVIFYSVKMQFQCLQLYSLMTVFVLPVIGKVMTM